jgi:uncharacterized membrane protein YfcA
LFVLPDFPTWRWVLAIFCAFNIGVAKTGMPGLGILAVPLFVVAVGDARLSAGWLLPVLLTADIFAVISYRKESAAGALFKLFPYVAVGGALGGAVLSFPEHIIRPLVGAIILACILLFFLRLRGINLASETGHAHSAFFGSAAGFSTMVANAAGPVMNIYLLSQNLPREQFVATGAWFFFLVNLSKIPIYSWQGLISAQSLSFGAALVVPALLGAFTGRRVIKYIPERVFTTSVIGLAIVATIVLFLPR